MPDINNSQGQPPLLLTVAQVCQRLNMSKSFIYQEVSSGRLEHYQMGRRLSRIRVSERQLSEYLETFRKGLKRVETPAFDLVMPPAKTEMSRNLSSLLS